MTTVEVTTTCHAHSVPQTDNPECNPQPKVANCTGVCEFECSYTHMTDFGALLGERPQVKSSFMTT